jgi:hypothetical protein
MLGHYGKNCKQGPWMQHEQGTTGVAGNNRGINAALPEPLSDRSFEWGVGLHAGKKEQATEKVSATIH